MAMKNVGGLMVLFGAGSMVLGLVGYEFTLMMWVDMWGPTVGWVIRIALIAVGGFMWLRGDDMDGEQLEESDAA
jgi:hypothetical protein